MLFRSFLMFPSHDSPSSRVIKSCLLNSIDLNEVFKGIDLDTMVKIRKYYPRKEENVPKLGSVLLFTTSSGVNPSASCFAFHVFFSVVET